jgi:hypothetical protein
MDHKQINTGLLRAYLDGEVNAGESSAIAAHLEDCAGCRDTLAALKSQAGGAHDQLQHLPQLEWDAEKQAAAWRAFQQKRNQAMENVGVRWNPWRTWSLAGAGTFVAMLALVFTVAPVRSWAENFLAIFRVQHFTVLELNPQAMRASGLADNSMLNQTITHMLSDDVTVTEKPQPPQLVPDVATAAAMAKFPLHLIAGQTPSALVFRGTVAAQMKLDRDRLQSILDEAGRRDLVLPSSVDGATIGMRVPAGIIASYGSCGDVAARMTAHKAQQGAFDAGDATCTTLMELPSPTVSAPKEIDPAEIAQVGLELLGMSANDAANFTATVDWTTTLVVPVVQGQSSYAKVDVNGAEGVLLRSRNPQRATRYTLTWVNDGIVYGLTGTGDDAAALHMAELVE